MGLLCWSLAEVQVRMGLLGVALGAGEGLVTHLWGRSTKRFNKTLRSALPASVWPSLLQLLYPVPTWARSSPSAAPWSCCPWRPFSVLLLSSQPPAPHTRPFPRILRELELVPGTPGSGSSQPLSWGRSLPRCPQAQPAPLPPSGGAASRPPRHAHGHLTSLAPHERLPELPVKRT